MSLACPTMQTAQATAESAERSLKASAGQPTHAPGATNASRNMHAKFAKLGYSLPIEIECTEHVCTSEDVQTLQNFTTYHVKPRSWIRHWMTHAPELLGGCSGPASDNFEAFWRTYEVQHPNHVVFETHSHQLEKVVPLLLHGDEGRTVKRTNYLVMSMESPLGSVNDPNIRCACSEEMAGRKDLPSYGNDLGTLKKDRFIYVISQVIRILGLDFTLHYVSIVLGVSRVYIYILFWCFLGDLGKWEKSI